MPLPSAAEPFVSSSGPLAPFPFLVAFPLRMHARSSFIRRSHEGDGSCWYGHTPSHGAFSVRRVVGGKYDRYPRHNRRAAVN